MAYAIVGWLLIEVSRTPSSRPVQLPATGRPPSSLVFLILGFPLALILSWAYELTPEGMKRSHEVPATESITQTTGRKIDFAIIGALSAGLGIRGLQLCAGRTTDPGESEIRWRNSRDTVLPNSVAVLPFENLSPILTTLTSPPGYPRGNSQSALAKLGTSTSSLELLLLHMRTATRPIPEIAEELNVETVMEGSASLRE